MWSAALLRCKSFSTLSNYLPASKKMVCFVLRLDISKFVLHGKDAGMTESFSRCMIDIACNSHLFASWL